MKIVYLDVRTPEEYAEGYYPDAINHDVNLLMMGTFPNESLVSKQDDVKVYCRSGARAGVAKDILEKAGYEMVENVGGLSDLL